MFLRFTLLLYLENDQHISIQIEKIHIQQKNIDNDDIGDFRLHVSMITYTCLVVLLPVKMAATLCGKLLQSRGNIYVFIKPILLFIC